MTESFTSLLSSRLRRLRRPGVLRWLAGIAGGQARSRRGSVLVLILGALAMLAVITVVYVTVGQADRRTGAIVTRNDTVDAAVGKIADHIAQIIADDALATFCDTKLNLKQGILAREAFDYPSIDWVYSSFGSPPPLGKIKFDPIGTNTTPWPQNPGYGKVDKRVPCDPWLASTVPTWLHSDGTSMYGPNWVNARARDWANLTNVAPDGRVVNLYNLRNNFEAKSGFGTESNGKPRTSENLSLLNANLQATLTLDWGKSLDESLPATWTSRQQYAFRPAGKDPNYGPGDPRYAPYQWADADGDGMFDARWQELVDASDPNNPISLLPRDGRFKYFFAARVEDLSSRANINTATDFVRAPDGTTPAGVFPDVVDIRRLLQLSDAYYDATIAVGYEWLVQPVNGTSDDYSSYDPQKSAEVGRYGFAGAQASIANAVVPGYNVSLIESGMTPWERTRYYLYSGAHIESASYYKSASVKTHGLACLFGPADLLELLTYRGYNDPTVSSRLEQAIDGRFTDAIAKKPVFGSLRSNRSASIEADSVDADGDGFPDAADMIRAAVDARGNVTTISGARQLRCAPVALGAEGVLNPLTDERIDAVAALQAATSATLQPDPSSLLAGYAQALLPFSGEKFAWDPVGVPRLATMHYGRSAELALRMAAQLTANAADSFDTDADPRAYTLLIDGAQRGAVKGDPAKYPFWGSEPDDQSSRGRLDLDQALGLIGSGTTRMANTGTGDPAPKSPAINVYGIEAQPFFSQVATYNVYSDAPQSAGGDLEYNVQQVQPPIIEPLPVTINGTVSQANQDFLGQVLAFQITNPFNVDVGLTKSDTVATPDGTSVADNDFSDFYLEFGGDVFKLARVDDGGAQTAVVLKPGETRVFYALNDNPAAIQARWVKMDANIGPDKLKDFIKNQLSVLDNTVDPPQLRNPIRIVPINGTSGVSKSGFVPFLQGSDDTKRRVLMWRAIRPSAEQNKNLRVNDMLADRLREPTNLPPSAPKPVLERSLQGSNQNVNGTLCGPEYPDPNCQDNTGYSIVTWGTLKRADNPTLTMPLGSLPAYCVEARWGTGTLSNSPAWDLSKTKALTKSDFSGSPPHLNGDDFFFANNGLMTRLAAVPPGVSGVLINNMTIDPAEKSGDSIGSNQSQPPKTYTQLIPEIPLDNGKFQHTQPNGGPKISTLRIADMLLPLAVGPMQDPNAPASPSDPIYPGWMTLGEALALALDYDNPPVGDLYEHLGRDDAANNIFPKVDRGNLVLDDFAPYEDNDQNGVFENSAGKSDRRRTPGVPLALNVLDVFRTIDPQFGTLTKSTPGLVNINTAWLPVLRALPMLSPTKEPTAFPWWGNGNSRLPQTTTDIAATLVAYRDKMVLPDRSGSSIVRFDDSTQIEPDMVFGRDGRFQTTGIDGIREDPGFTSIGELMALIDPIGTRVAQSNRIDVLGVDGVASGVPGITSTLYNNGSPNKVPNNIVDDYAEKLALAQSLMGCVSVRSDVYAVWFVVHGYQRSDCEGLSDTKGDPLVPSIAKRYVMVVDRSNVTRTGEKPKLLLFSEVPM